MHWLERIAVSAFAAAVGALVTLVWVDDGGPPPDASERPASAATIMGGPSAMPDLVRLEDEVAAQAEALAQLNADNAELRFRLRELERLELGDGQGSRAAESSLAESLASDEAQAAASEEEPPELPPAERMMRAGIEPSLAEAIEERIAALEMERLYLRDQATREGWRDSDRFAEAMRELVQPEDALRNEFGDDVYDQYLYAMGQGNRVLVTSTLENSPADVAGIRAGDTVLSYAGERVYSVRDLQSATTAGEPGASVVVELMRDGVRWYATVPRGPLGVRLDITRRAPGTG